MSMEFTYDIEMIFNKDSVLELHNEKMKSCAGEQQESLFENNAKGNWWDPDSWECSPDVLDCNAAVPHVHRVPCFGDAVRLPNVNDSLYNIIFTDPVPTVKTLFLGDQNLSTSKFFDFSTSSEGQQRITKQFSTVINNRVPLYIESEEVCQDFTGCHCHASVSDEQICKYKRNKCSPTTCSTPAKMKGFCCDMCGAEIVITHNGTLALSFVRDLLQRVLKMEEGKDCHGYVNKMPDNHYHVYFVGKDDAVDYTKPLHMFTELFEREFNMNGHHVLQTNIARGSVAEKLARRLSQNSQLIAILFFTCFLVMGTAFFIYLYRKRRVHDLPFMFRRMSFRGMSVRSSRSTSIPSSSHLASFRSSDGRSFINPTFGTSERLDSFPSLSVLQENLNEISEIECPTQRENPMYSVQMEQGISFASLKKINEITDERIPEEIVESEKSNGASSTEVLVHTSTSPDTEAVNIETQNNSVSDLNELNVQTHVHIEQEDEDKEEEEVEEKDEDPLEMLAKSRIEKSLEKIEEKEYEKEGEEGRRQETQLEEQQEENFNIYKKALNESDDQGGIQFEDLEDLI